MAASKPKSPQKSETGSASRLKKSVCYLVASLATGSGVGGWAFPDLPVVGSFARSLGWLLATLVGIVGSFAGSADPPGSVGQGPESVRIPQSHSDQATYHQATGTAATGGGAIVIGSFNIQVFGTAKMEKPWVADLLATVARRFHVLAIQELRSSDEQLLDRFVQMVNAPGARYAYLVGPRLGRTSSKEQYVFLYDTTHVEALPGRYGTVGDPSDLMHREPFVAHFRVRTSPQERGFTFWLVNVHTDPDEVRAELDVLADVFTVMLRQGGSEDDVILLGDLNADERNLGKLGALPNMAWAISGQPTNTRGNRTYDNILFDRLRTTEFTGQAGVWNLMADFKLSQERALEVSDHFPVWAVFSAFESPVPGPVAAMPTARY